MRKLSWMLLVLLVVGCGEEIADDEDKAVKDLVKDEVLVEDKVVLDADLAKKITWEKDGSKMMLIPGGSFQMGDHFNEGGKDEQPVHTVELDAFYYVEGGTLVAVGSAKEFVKLQIQVVSSKRTHNYV